MYHIRTTIGIIEQIWHSPSVSVIVNVNEKVSQALMKF